MKTNQELIEQYSNLIWNEKDLSAVDRFIAKEVIIHSPLEELKGSFHMRSIIEKWLVAFPDLAVLHEEWTCQGDMVVSRWKAIGTHQGEFKKVKATGRKVTYEGASFYRLQDQKVISYWAFVNIDHILNQLK